MSTERVPSIADEGVTLCQLAATIALAGVLIRPPRAPRPKEKNRRDTTWLQTV